MNATTTRTTTRPPTGRTILAALALAPGAAVRRSLPSLRRRRGAGGGTEPRREAAATSRARPMAAGWVGLLGAFVGALLVGALLGTAGPVAAEPITTPSRGWTPANFKSSCEAAGGDHDEFEGMDGGHYSVCDFGNGAVNSCDWDRKTCTFAVTPRAQRRTGGAATGGVLAQPEATPTGPAAPVSDGAATTEGAGDAGGSTVHVGTYAAPTGGRVVPADDDDRP